MAVGTGPESPRHFPSPGKLEESQAEGSHSDTKLLRLSAAAQPD